MMVPSGKRIQLWKDPPFLIRKFTNFLWAILKFVNCSSFPEGTSRHGSGKSPIYGGFIGKSPRNGPFSIAMLDHRRVIQWFLTVTFPYHSILRPRSCSAAVVALQASVGGRLSKVSVNAQKTWEIPMGTGIPMDHPT